MYEKFGEILDAHGYYDLADIWDDFLPHLLHNKRYAQQSSINIESLRQKSPYELFGLLPGATKDDVRRKYKEYARKYHPDVNNDPLATEAFKLSAPALDQLLAETEERPFNSSTPSINDTDWIMHQMDRKRRDDQRNTMNQHVTDEQIKQYSNKSMNTNEQTKYREHMRVCPGCRYRHSQYKHRPLHEKAWSAVEDTAGNLWEKAKQWYEQNKSE